MMHRPWSSIVEVPYCFSRSNVKFQGHTALKIVKFYRNWAFLDSNSSLNSLMVMKCCTKLETAKERCPMVFQSHPSNFKVTRDKTSSLLTRIGRFRTIGRSQLSNPSDLPCLTSDDFINENIGNTNVFKNMLMCKIQSDIHCIVYNTFYFLWRISFILCWNYWLHMFNSISMA